MKKWAFVTYFHALCGMRKIDTSPIRLTIRCFCPSTSSDFGPPPVWVCERLAAEAQVLASLFMQDHFFFISAADRLMPEAAVTSAATSAQHLSLAVTDTALENFPNSTW